MRMRLAFLTLAGLLLASCAEQTKQVAHPDYNLMNEIYGADMNKLQYVFQAPEPNYQTLNPPTYVKVYHGSYKDDQGNVINGGFMWLKLSNGKPETNF